jgi:dienelactone hydrolase
MNPRRTMAILRGMLAALPVLLGPASPSCDAEEKPKALTPPEVWSAYDPDAGEFNEEVLKRWTENGAEYKEVFFSAHINGQTVRVYGLYAAPGRAGTPVARVPAVMHLHGGGQTVNKQWLEAFTARGYAALTCNYHGVWENRERFTIYPEALKQGNHKLNAGKEMATTPTVRESSWYIWSAVARRALSYLRQQPAVDRERIGAFGISMGGTTIWSFAQDPRLKAACAIYGCGWNRYYRHTPRYGPSGKVPAMTEDDRVWLAGMAPEAYPPFIKCPVLFLSATNDNHGNMDRAYETLAKMPAAVESRQAFTPRFCHHIGADFDQDLFLWMDTWLKGGPAWPKSPVAKVALGPDGVPVVTLTADRPAQVERVAIYYAVENPRAVSRNWRNATAARSGDCWQAPLPVLNAEASLFAFANVRYRSGVYLSSNEEAVVPSTLGAAKATDTVSSVLFDGSDGTGMWVTGSPCTDPVPPGRIPVPIRPATGPEGKAGFTVNSHAAPITYQPGDPKWRAPEGAALRFEVATTTGEEVTVALHQNYSWPGQKTWEAKVSLKGQPGWQTVALFAANFKEKGAGGAAPPGFARCDALQFTGPWKDKDIVFTGVRWVKK